MKLDAIHHITCITADGPRNADFYVGVLGLRLVKKTVNFDVADAYHLYYGDDEGSPGTIFTFFEYPQAEQGRAGAGMIHRIQWRVGGRESLEYWARRLTEHGFEGRRLDDSLRFRDFEGLEHELVADKSSDVPRSADAPTIPPEHRIVGLQGVRAYSTESAASDILLDETLGFRPLGRGEHVLKDHRMATYTLDAAPHLPGVSGAGTVHHIAWACRPEEQAQWQARTRDAGMEVTDVLDRKYFTSIYFREPSGVLFEIATLGPGFTVDEPVDRLGEALQLPEWQEDLRPRLEKTLRPIDAMRPGERSRTSA
jgi:glyoxalase family protein